MFGFGLLLAVWAIAGPPCWPGCSGGVASRRHVELSADPVVFGAMIAWVLPRCATARASRSWLRRDDHAGRGRRGALAVWRAAAGNRSRPGFFARLLDACAGHRRGAGPSLSSSTGPTTGTGYTDPSGGLGTFLGEVVNVRAKGGLVVPGEVSEAAWRACFLFVRRETRRPVDAHRHYSCHAQ